MPFISRISYLMLIICYSLLEETGDQFPEGFLKMKVLPELLKAVEYGGGLSRYLPHFKFLR